MDRKAWHSWLISTVGVQLISLPFYVSPWQAVINIGIMLLIGLVIDQAIQWSRRRNKERDEGRSK